MCLEGYIECPVCGFGYIQEDIVQHERHRTFHAEIVEGAYLPADAWDRVIGEVRGLEVLETAMDLPYDHRRRMAAVAYRSNRDLTDYPTAYDGGPEDAEWDGRAYILRDADRGIALAVLRRRFPTWWLPWGQYLKREALDARRDDSPRWTVDRLWMLTSRRRSGLSRGLINVLAAKLAVPIDDLAWLQEFTPDGEAFVRAVSPKGLWTCW